MSRSRLKPALFFDFDNTLTDGDVLDELIERYSADERWRDWEHAWECGRMSARDCLRLQIENMRISRDLLRAHVTLTRIDPAFADILAWAAGHGIDVSIVSDSFEPLITWMLAANGLGDVPVFANRLSFEGTDRLIPSFPYYDPAVLCSANAKASHLQRYRRTHRVVFAGDGHSDLDAALAADVVFAKATLARELDARAVTFYPFETLEPVLAFLEAFPLGADVARA